ncbi:LysR family transcriptional regulator [Saccharibacillus brassicae]|uniref:LysR family transcriptional regulator n=1 Tax=Saccharibacillus brassicae TaxID=2583377 RepID=A0A4Y6UZQ5_SACBS|nr:LysR family transcriptional regulator [Saccharibacillus brassicae]QDH23242.1 LysR family transcriptional regulator [Saccharibacillus brassicae]
MEIRVLRYFLAVAREGSLTGAAERLHLTQPTLSRQLKDLERQLGKPLFTRGSRRLSLTDEGRLLRRRAEEIVELADRLEAEFGSMEEKIGGDVHIGGGETQAMKRIARAVGRLRTDHPNIRYHLYSGNEDDVTERLDQGLLDFGVLIQPADVAKYHYLPLPDTDTWGVVMRKDNPLAAKKNVHRSDLMNVPLICSRQAMKQTFSENRFTAWFGADFDKLNVVTTYNLAYNAAILVEEGIGCALALDRIVNTSRESPLCFRPLAPPLESGLNLVWRKHQTFSAAAELFLETLRRTLSGDDPAD